MYSIPEYITSVGSTNTLNKHCEHWVHLCNIRKINKYIIRNDNISINITLLSFMCNIINNIIIIIINDHFKSHYV